MNDLAQNGANLNEFGQQIGPRLGNWSPPNLPPLVPIKGTNVRLEPLDRARHADALFQAFSAAPESLWTYMPYGPFADATEFDQLIDSITATAPSDVPDWQPYAVMIGESALGFLSYLRISPSTGSIEIGGITFSPQLQRTTAATEALYLMIKNVFDLGYRRCEWKCDHFNEPSRSAALRYGFVFEGIFAKATHYKGRSRDTAWFAITDDRWPAISAAFQSWLSSKNFNSQGRQKETLAALRAQQQHS